MAISTGAAILGSTVLGAGASLLGSKKQSDAAEKAGDAQFAATQLSIDEQRRQFDLARGDLREEQDFLHPFREHALQIGQNAANTGQNALFAVADLSGVRRPFGGRSAEEIQAGQDNALAAFRTSPGYQFRLGEGLKAVQNSAAARGLLHSGGTMKGVQRFGEGLASSEFDSHVNRLMAMAGLGSNAAAGTANQGAGIPGQNANLALTSGQNIGNALMAGGNARASSYLAQGNAQAQGIAGIGSAANSGIQNMLLSQYLSRMPTGQLPRA